MPQDVIHCVDPRSTEESEATYAGMFQCDSVKAVETKVDSSDAEDQSGEDEDYPTNSAISATPSPRSITHLNQVATRAMKPSEEPVPPATPPPSSSSQTSVNGHVNGNLKLNGAKSGSPRSASASDAKAAVSGHQERSGTHVELGKAWQLPKERRWLMRQVLVAVSVSMGSFLIGFTSAYTSPALESMNSEDSVIRVTEAQEAWIGSLMPLSAMVGALVSGWLIERIGRRMTVAGTALPFLVSYVMIAMAGRVETIYAARVVAGLAVGVLSLVMPVYLGETMHAQVRGTLGLFPTTIGNSGILVCFLFGSFLRWDHLALSAVIFPVLFAALMWFTPESPHWYLAKERSEEAQASLQWLRGGSDGAKPAQSDTAQDTSRELAAMKSHVQRSRNELISWRVLLQRRHMRPLLISLTLMFFQQMSGINAVIFYANRIFKMSGSSIDSGLSSVVIGLVNLVATLVANLLIDRVGRKKLLYVSSAAMAVNLALLGGYFYLHDLGADYEQLTARLGFVPLTCLIVFMLAFSLGWGPIPWLFLGEGLPSQTRGLVGSIAATFNWVCTFVVTKTFSDMVHLVGAQGMFWLFSSLIVLSIVVVFFFVPETKGKTLEAIEHRMQYKKEKDSVSFA